MNECQSYRSTRAKKISAVMAMDVHEDARSCVTYLTNAHVRGMGEG